MESTCGVTNVDLRKFSRDQLRLMKPRRDLARAFDEFRINDSRFLEEAEGRSRCTECGQSRKYFCYSCFLPLERFEDRVPSVQLPFHVDILKHAREVSGKSTAVHAPIVAREHVRLYTYPHIPDYRGTKERVVLISPGPGALKLEDLIEQSIDGSAEQSRDSPFDRAVLIDCTWNQVKKILLDPRVKGLQRVELSQHETLFWRYQTGKPNTYLATIEALFYFVLDVHKMMEHNSTNTHGTVVHRALRRGTHTGTHEPSMFDRETEVSIKAMQSQDLTRTRVVTAVTNSQAKDEASSPLFPLNSNETECEQPTRYLLSQCLAGDDCKKVISSKTQPGCDTEEIYRGSCLEENTKTDHKSSRNEAGNGEVSFIKSAACTRPALSSHAFVDHNQLFIDDCCHRYDNLLFYFKFMFDKIHNIYGIENLRAYKSALLHIQSALLHIQSALLYTQSALLHTQSALLHTQSALLHTQSALLHTQSALLHTQSALLHTRSGVLHIRSGVLHIRSGVLHIW
ncbi:DTW protein [Trinorchestia longiramus]|nr:DTW protein [Trinorchestia longiramus]